MRTFFFALVAPARCLMTLVRRKALWPLAAGPLLASATVLLLVGAAVYLGAGTVTGWVWPTPSSSWLYPIWWLFEFIIAGMMMAVGVVTAILVGTTMASPIFSGLSRSVEADWLGELKTTRFTFASLVPQLPSLLGIALKRTSRYLFFQLPLMGLALIPVAGEVLSVGGEFFLTGTFLAVSFLDAPLSRRNYSHTDRVRFLMCNLPGIAGLGIGLEILILILIPGVDLLILPVGTLAGTLVFLSLEQMGRVPKRAPELVRT